MNLIAKNKIIIVYLLSIQFSFHLRFSSYLEYSALDFCLVLIQFYLCISL